MNQTFSNVPVSKPIAHEDLEDLVMGNGFSWSSTQGLIHQVSVAQPGPLASWFGSK